MNESTRKYKLEVWTLIFSFRMIQRKPKANHCLWRQAYSMLYEFRATVDESSWELDRTKADIKPTRFDYTWRGPTKFNGSWRGPMRFNSSWRGPTKINDSLRKSSRFDGSLRGRMTFKDSWQEPTRLTTVDEDQRDFTRVNASQRDWKTVDESQRDLTIVDGANEIHM